MEKLKSFLVTRMLLILLAVLAAEGAVSLLVERVILPVILRLSGDGVTEAVRLRDVLAIAGGALFGNGQQVLLSRIGGSVPVLLLMLCMLLYLFPILAGLLFYVRLVTDRVDAMQKERDAERNAYEEQRNLMLSDIAHDLRTPIMTISGYAGALADGMVSSEEQKQEYLEAIRRKSMRLGELINVFFDYVRLGSAHFTLRKKQIDLHEMLLECAAGLYSDVEEAGMELRVEIPETPYPVCADRAQLMRVIWNLLINAIRHNPAGTQILLRADRMAGIERIAVADTGVRIERKAEDLFEPFAKGDESRTGETGSGLGLSVAKKITEMHGYSLELIQPFEDMTKAFVIAVPREEDSDKD